MWSGVLFAKNPLLGPRVPADAPAKGKATQKTDFFPPNGAILLLCNIKQQGADKWAFGKRLEWADTRDFRGMQGFCWTKLWSWRAGLAAAKPTPATFCWRCFRSTTARRGVSLPERTSRNWQSGVSWPKSVPVLPSIWTAVRWLRTCAVPWIMPSSGRRTHTSPGLSRNICSAPCWRIPTVPPGCFWRRWGSS